MARLPAIQMLCAALAVWLLAALPVQAQYGGGGGGGGGHGRGNRGSSTPSTPDTSAAPAPAPIPPEKPVDQIDIIGVVEAIDLDADRITIAYEPVPGLGWPRGSMPFEVSQPNLLKAVSVGDRVRFRLESHQIYQMAPFGDLAAVSPSSPAAARSPP